MNSLNYPPEIIVAFMFVANKWHPEQSAFEQESNFFEAYNDAKGLIEFANRLGFTEDE